MNCLRYRSLSAISPFESWPVSQDSAGVSQFRNASLSFRQTASICATLHLCKPRSFQLSFNSEILFSAALATLINLITMNALTTLTTLTNMNTLIPCPTRPPKPLTPATTHTIKAILTLITMTTQTLTDKSECSIL